MIVNFRYVMDHIDLGVWDYDTRNDTFTVSDAWRQMRGQTELHPFPVAYKAWLQDVHPDDRDRLDAIFKGNFTGDSKSIVVQYRCRHENGHWIWILSRASIMGVDENGTPAKIVGTDTDISTVKSQEKDLYELTGKLQLAIEASGMGIWEFDPSTSQVHWDDRMLEIYGIEDGQNIRCEAIWGTYIHPDDYAGALAYAEDCKRKKTDFKRDYRIVQPNGKIRHIRSLARNVTASNAQSKLIGVNIDVTNDYLRAEELELARKQLEHDSRHDALTGLGNRRKADETTLALFSRISDEHAYAAMHIDLDLFKRVNDELGHSAGDYVLTTVAQKLRVIIGDLGQVFRVGGDEFSILFEAAPSADELDHICRDIIDHVSAPLKYQDQDCSVGASIGYAFGKGPPDNPSEIFINADTALYSAKHAGRSCFKAYSTKLKAEVNLVANARQNLVNALQNNEIICHYQPQYEQVFKCVAASQSQWAALGIRYPRVSVNISKSRLDEDNLIDKISTTLESHHLFSFELLETAFLDNIDTALAFKLDALQDLGIHIELDDFGSGHSSIVALQTRLTVVLWRHLKINRIKC